MTMQTHPCPRCGTEFDTCEALDQHLFRTHTGEVETRSYRCATSGSKRAWKKRSCGGS